MQVQPLFWNLRRLLLNLRRLPRNITNQKCLLSRNMAPTMVKPRKKDTSEEMSSIVDQTLRISNLSFFEGRVQIQSFIST